MKFLVNIFGPSNSGKSTLADELGNRHPGSYLISFDKLKWQLYGYQRGKDRDVIKQIFKGLFETVTKLGLSMLATPLLYSESELQEWNSIASSQGYHIINVCLTTPQDVLLERFRTRVKEAREAGRRLSLSDEKEFLDRMNNPYFYTPMNMPSFDTSTLTPIQIADEVEKLLK